MKTKQLLALAMTSSLFTSLPAAAQTNDPDISRLAEAAEVAPPLNRLSLAYRAGLNLNVRFKGLGGFQPESNPGPATGTKQVHTYDDGYFLPDSRSGNIDNYTWNWGFNSPSQVQPGAGTPYGSLLLHSASAPANTESDNNDPRQGFEIAFDRQLGEIGRARWGVEGAFNFTDVSVQNAGTLFGNAVVTTDTYALEGLNPFTAGGVPYHGTFNGPGPLPVDSPMSRQVQSVAGGAIINGSRNLDANLFGFRLGPYLELPIGKRFAVSVQGGLALVLVDSDFSYSETVTLTSSGRSQSSSGSSSSTQLMAGFQVSGTVSYAFSRSLSAYASAQFQDVGTFTQSSGSKSAQLDLNAGVFLLLGISYSF